ncbi:MAG: hypothetical protein M1820_002199 [Bogoriella megaspora]|nr:MAG: hypothetical protein M1820_002199 [Bogoriella megaspora]
MPTTPGVVTATFGIHTLTSPTVYYSFDWVMTSPEDEYRNGSWPNRLLNQLLPINSSDVSTMYFADGVFHTNAMDWSNLYAPVPLMAYQQGDQCCGGCSTIFDDYLPRIAIPKQVSGLLPAWSTCKPGRYGVVDPPHVLQTTSAAATPMAASDTRTILSTVMITPAPRLVPTLITPTSSIDPHSPSLPADQARYLGADSLTRSLDEPQQADGATSLDLASQGLNTVNIYNLEGFTGSGDCSDSAIVTGLRNCNGSSSDTAYRAAGSNSTRSLNSVSTDPGPRVGAAIWSVTSGMAGFDSPEGTEPDSHPRPQPRERSPGDIIASALGITRISEDSFSEGHSSAGSKKSSVGGGSLNWSYSWSIRGRRKYRLEAPNGHFAISLCCYDW